MHLRILLLALIIGNSPALAQDQPPQGQASIDLMRSCQGRGTYHDLAASGGGDAQFFGGFDLLECTSYLAGIVDMNSMAQGVFGKGFFCLPERGISGEQQIMVFLKWAEAHPELLHESRRSGVIGAFAEAFPCE